ncbi:Rpn family recombination-promoting nuclease/putative transposase [Candidatus Falkowbacteria bacterium]|nr:Rpn family recombination-promoting nuclease/putative transposase [Candidatus Falkowbacteria bacterium]
MHYLDPKNDLTFKKVFGEHPHLLKSFLNALLPLGEGRCIEHLEYLPADLVPETPLMKYSIVDVRCCDNYGRQFIVEMQLAWTTGFMQRVLFNASKAYVKQLDKAFVYKALQPVYALSLVNEIFEPDTPEFYHHYQIVNIADTEKQLEGLEFVFVELPKFKAAKFSEKKLQVLWLRFLTEIDEHSTHIPEELLGNSEITEALENVRVSAFTKAELDTYDRYWDRVRVELTFKDEYYTKGLKEGEERGEAERTIAIVKNAITAGMSNELIATLTGLTDAQIDAVRKEIKNKK